MIISEDKPVRGAVKEDDRKIRLLEILGNAIIGGMESTVIALISHLPPNFEVTCVCPYESAFTARLRAIGCTVYITAIRDDPPWSAIEFVTAIIRQHRIDVIQAHLLNAHTLGAIAANLAGRPLVATIHSMAMMAQELSVARIAGSHLITVCQQAYAQALAAGLPPERLSLVRNGVDIGRFRPDRNSTGFREKVGIPHHVPLVGFVGRLAHEKGADKFVLAAQLVCEQHPSAHLVLVGEGPEQDRLRRAIERSGHTDRIHTAGAWLSTEQVYCELTILVQSSRSEAMPLVLLEAMASALPVVALAVGDVASIIEAGATGIAISPVEWPGVASPYPGDWQGLAAAVLDLLDKPELMAAMGSAGRARAVAMFDIEESAARTAAVLRGLVTPRLGRNTATLAHIR